jgi:Sporulation protein YtfJ (Spore_YtfJ)
MGPFEVSQGSLLIAAVVVTIPAPMIVVSAAVPFPSSASSASEWASFTYSSVSATSSVSPGLTTWSSAEKDGMTIIPAARVQGGAGVGSGEDPQGQGKGSGSGFGMTARPVGAFVIREGELTGDPR